MILIGFLFVEYSVETNLHPSFSISHRTSAIVNRGGIVIFDIWNFGNLKCQFFLGGFEEFFIFGVWGSIL
jgi:hypothetical protein